MRIALAALLTLGVGCNRAPMQWPTSGWQTSAPAGQGLDPAALKTLDDAFARGDHGYVNSFLLIRHGHVVYEASYPHDYQSLFQSAPDQTRGAYNYYDPDWHPFYRGTALHTMQSVSKSVTSALIGIAIRRGQISGVDAKALPFFDGYTVASDPRRQSWTLRHLLTMTAGVQWEEIALPYTDPGNTCAAMEASQNWEQFVLNQPMSADPGTSFVYNSGATQLLSEVVRKSTGMHADAYAAEHLFRPLGITEYSWKHTPTGHADTEGGLYLMPRDLAKIGLLYLRDGVWEDTRILPVGWVTASTTAQVTTGGDPRGLDYGFQWWVERNAARASYAAVGYGGQRLVVIPDADIIAVFTGWTIFGTPPLDVRFAVERLRGMARP
jgi:CubicO group peptidase (beta-lactamase class C family)